MFLSIESSHNTIIKDDSGNNISYAEAVDFIETMKRSKIPRCLIFCLCENTAGSLLGYLAFENNGQVPLLLNAKLDNDLRNKLDLTYRPSFYWAPQEVASSIDGEVVFSAYNYVMKKTKWQPYPLNKKLSLLLPTSGTTGSPKLVRHKYGNLEANAFNVAKVFQWTEKERGICNLQMHYTMGLNVINSYIAAKSTVLLCKKNLMDPELWDFIKEEQGTSICGVPFSYEVMRRIAVDKMDLPELRVFAEGGGKLTDKMFSWWNNYCKESGKAFYATFGTTETSARMSCLTPDHTTEKIGSIGKAIPGGELFIVNEIEDEKGFTVGELGYRGPNVTMGYAICKEDLLKGDDFNGEYHTGDIAKRDQDGFYYNSYFCCDSYNRFFC